MFLSSEGLFDALSDWSMDEWEGIYKFGSCRGREERRSRWHTTTMVHGQPAPTRTIAVAIFGTWMTSYGYST